MSPARPRRRLLRRVFLSQALAVLAGAATLGAVAFLVAPPIFRDHVRRAMGPVSDVVAHHLDAALTETLVLALLLGIAMSVVAAAGMSWLLATRLSRPVEALSRSADALAAGHLDTRATPPTTDDELTDLTRAFNAMADTLERTEQARRRLLADLAHELRTPLATIEGYHEGLRDGVVEADAATLAVLDDATGRLQRLVDDVALVSRAEEGQLRLDRQEVDLRELVDQALEAARPAADQAGVVLDGRTPGKAVGATVDPDRIRQVLANLLANAIGHTPRGGRVTTTVASTPQGVVVEVADTGAGIDPEHLPHVFERFYRADPSRHHTRGSGIGLTISRAIVAGHGGELTAASDGRGHGASFTLTLPCARAG